MAFQVQTVFSSQDINGLGWIKPFLSGFARLIPSKFCFAAALFAF